MATFNLPAIIHASYAIENEQELTDYLSTRPVQLQFLTESVEKLTECFGTGTKHLRVWSDPEAYEGLPAGVTAPEDEDMRELSVEIEVAGGEEQARGAQDAFDDWALSDPQRAAACFEIIFLARHV